MMKLPTGASSASLSNMEMTPSPSDLSLRDHDASNSSIDQLADGDKKVKSSEEIVEILESKKLGKQLLQALYLGTSNFLLAYNLRAGVGLLMRIFKLLRKKNVRSVLDLRELLDESKLSFRVDAVSLGLFIGGFSGGYRALLAVTSHLLSHHVRDAKHRLKIASVTSAAVASLSLFSLNKSRQRSVALYAFTRALQTAYNMLKNRGAWHFWGSDWAHGDSLLFGLSSAQVMYAYVMRPSTLPAEYMRFIQGTSPTSTQLMKMVRECNRGLPLDRNTLAELIRKNPHLKRVAPPMPLDYPPIIPCAYAHAEATGCVHGSFRCFYKAFLRNFPLYLSLFLAPSLVLQHRRFLSSPGKMTLRAVTNAARSNAFVSCFVTLFLALVCVHRKVVSTDHRFMYYLFGLGASLSIFVEQPSRRSELALYVFPRALDSLYLLLKDRRMVGSVPHGEVALFASSMGVLLYCYEKERDSVAPFLGNVLERFLKTNEEKRQKYLISKSQQTSTNVVSTSTHATIPE